MVMDPEHGTVDSPGNPDELQLMTGAAQAVARLNSLELMVAVVTNQPGVAKGRFSRELHQGMERKLVEGVEAGGGRLDAIYTCLHHPKAKLEELRATCDCRKPKPGLILQAAREHGLQLSGSFMVGDGVTDIEAGQAAGLTTLFVGPRKCYTCDALVERGSWPNYWVENLSEAVDVIAALEHGDHASVSRFVPHCSTLRQSS